MNTNHTVRHGFDFFLLVLILCLGLGGLLYFNFNKAAQISIVIIMSAMYIFWGIYHHHHDGNLTFKTLFEYIGIASLVAAVLIVMVTRI